MLDDDRKVTYSDKKHQWTIRRGNVERTYDEIVMSFVFGNPVAVDETLRNHAIAVAGRQPDNLVIVLFLAWAYWHEATTLAIDVKDRFWIRRCLVPPQPEQMVDQLRELEGFSLYRKVRLQENTKERYENPPETWDEFRDYNLICSVEEVHEMVLDDLPSLILQVDQWQREHKIKIAQGCAYADLTDQFGRFPHESQYDPRHQAVLFAIEAALPRKYESSLDRTQAKPWYPG